MAIHGLDFSFLLRGPGPAFGLHGSEELFGDSSTRKALTQRSAYTVPKGFSAILRLASLHDTD
jgi:hypothetical protein